MEATQQIIRRILRGKVNSKMKFVDNVLVAITDNYY